jgi:hypothetical protein
MTEFPRSGKEKNVRDRNFHEVEKKKAHEIEISTPRRGNPRGCGCPLKDSAREKNVSLCALKEEDERKQSIRETACDSADHLGGRYRDVLVAGGMDGR